MSILFLAQARSQITAFRRMQIILSASIVAAAGFQGSTAILVTRSYAIQGIYKTFEFQI